MAQAVAVVEHAVRPITEVAAAGTGHHRRGRAYRLLEVGADRDEGKVVADPALDALHRRSDVHQHGVPAVRRECKQHHVVADFVDTVARRTDRVGARAAEDEVRGAAIGLEYPGVGPRADLAREGRVVGCSDGPAVHRAHPYRERVRYQAGRAERTGTWCPEPYALVPRTERRFTASGAAPSRGSPAAALAAVTSDSAAASSAARIKMLSGIRVYASRSSSSLDPRRGAGPRSASRANIPLPQLRRRRYRFPERTYPKR